ncbi:hypothetical protein TSL6_17900 [Sulfurovum sp. TSL6]|uniref:hypothetical protein n=1 Tax=Sulfurovum sp. TSL6 TaxID=2826995 RepID=UPI001CC6EEBB|nr:hypothetical protein [Sulfurovum sp. TSL6]GIU01284.1 hypothetical protein TSL6_17900 [Sulfurovum sp. TSL6]
MADLREEGSIAGLSLKTFLVTVLGILLFGIYIGILVYGENSLTVLNQLKEKKQGLSLEEKILKVENQRLQKEYFELKQLEPKE